MIAKPFARANQGAACVIPGRDGKWWARADLPWPDAYGHLASHARARTPEEALDRAIGGAIICGGAIDSPLVDRLRECGAFLLSEVSGDPSLSNAQLLAKYARDFHHEPPQKPAMVAFLRKRITPDGKWQRGGPKNISPTEVAHLVRVWMGAHGYTGDQARATPDWKAIERYVFTNERTRASMDSRINEALHRGGGFLDDVGDTLSDVVSAPVETISDAVKGKGALGYVVNPVSAATRAAIPKKLRRKYDAAMNSATGRAADMIAPGSSSLLSSLARGEGKANVPGAVRDGRGVSVPLRRAKKRQEEHDAQGGMTLYYHPAGSIGPVVVRF